MTSPNNSTTSDCEISFSRIVHAPISLVYRAWTVPDYLKIWWGPAGFTNTFSEFDFKVGGKWNFIMHGPDKGNYRNECEFTAIEEPNLIAWKRFTNPLFDVVATFEELSVDNTKIVFRQIFNSIAECNKIKTFVDDKNEEVFDRLEKWLYQNNS